LPEPGIILEVAAKNAVLIIGREFTPDVKICRALPIVSGAKKSAHWNWGTCRPVSRWVRRVNR
jgi:hypothetical protein